MDGKAMVALITEQIDLGHPVLLALWGAYDHFTVARAIPRPSSSCSTATAIPACEQTPSGSGPYRQRRGIASHRAVSRPSGWHDS
jgi:hypothetical protein